MPLDEAIYPLAVMLWQSSGFEDCHQYDDEQRWEYWGETSADVPNPWLGASCVLKAGPILPKHAGTAPSSSQFAHLAPRSLGD